MLHIEPEPATVKLIVIEVSLSPVYSPLREGAVALVRLAPRITKLRAPTVP